jgi:hypothetical protein
MSEPSGLGAGELPLRAIRPPLFCCPAIKKKRGQVFPALWAF